MIYDQVLGSIQKARTGNCLDALSRALWSQENSLSDDQAQTLAEAIQARRIILRGQGTRPAPIKARPTRNQSVSLARRRRLAASGPMPPVMASHFTTAELAALKIVADEVKGRGLCSLVLEAIAARAGISKRSVQNALREAQRLGFISIQHRRLRGQLKNLPNLIRITALEWLTWLKVAKPSSPRIETNKPLIQRIHHVAQPNQRAGLVYSRSLKPDRPQSRVSKVCFSSRGRTG